MLTSFISLYIYIYFLIFDLGPIKRAVLMKNPKLAEAEKVDALERSLIGKDSIDWESGKGLCRGGIYKWTETNELWWCLDDSMSLE